MRCADPLLAAWTVEERPAGPAENLLGATLQGLFAAFVITTAITLMALAIVLGTDDLVAIPVCLIAGALAAFVLVVQVRTGDCIPALLYLPTMVVAGLCWPDGPESDPVRPVVHPGA